MLNSFLREISRFSLVFSDYKSWMLVALTKFRNRHNNLFIGPIADSIGIFVICFFITFLWSKFWNVEFFYFYFYFFSGYTLWRVITTAINESMGIFIGEFKNISENTLIDNHLFFLTVVARNFFPLFYQFPIILTLSIYYEGLSYNIFLYPVFLIMLFLFLYPSSILLSLINLRFRDIGYFFQIFISLLFFFTPILWSSDRFAEIKNTTYGSLLIYGNPIYYFIDMYRSVFGLKEFDFLIIVLCFTLIIFLIFSSFLILSITRKKIFIWLRM